MLFPLQDVKSKTNVQKTAFSRLISHFFASGETPFSDPEKGAVPHFYKKTAAIL